MKLILFILWLLTSDFEKLYYDGFGYFNEKKYEMAIGKFESAYAIKKHSQVAYYLAYCHYNLNNKEQCLKYVKLAYESKPDLSSYYIDNMQYFVRYFNRNGSYEIDVTMSVEERKKYEEEMKKKMSAEEYRDYWDELIDQWAGLPHNYESENEMKELMGVGTDMIDDTNTRYFDYDTDYLIDNSTGYGEEGVIDKGRYFKFPVDSLIIE